MQRIEPAAGQLAGTGAAIDVNIGYRPRYVRLFNETALKVGEFYNGMADGSALVTNDSGVGTTDLQKLASNGITLTSQGFSVGTSVLLNNAADVIWYVAI